MKYLELIKKWEGLKLTAYQCQAGVWTISAGCTRYEDNKPINKGDKITIERAESLLGHTLIKYIECVKKSIKRILTDNQSAALISLCYNIGCSAFEKSTLVKMVNINPNDPLITNEFKKWSKVNGEINKGLLNRRVDEGFWYFK
jgi:lysozyme